MTRRERRPRAEYVPDVRLWDEGTGELRLEVLNDFGDVIDEYRINPLRLDADDAAMLNDVEKVGGAPAVHKAVIALHSSGRPGIKRAIASGTALPPVAPPARPASPSRPPLAGSASPHPPTGGGPMTSPSSPRTPPPFAPKPAPAAPKVQPMEAKEKKAREKRSCIDCPNFLPASQVPTRYGKAIGTPMCKFFDKPIGRSSHTPAEMQKVFEKVGTACDAFGKPSNDKPKRSFQIAFPDMRLTDLTSVDENLKQACSSCTMCKNFTPSDITTSELGWVAGLCNAKGELVQDHSTTFVGRTCDIRQFGTVRNTATVGLNLFPEYSEDFLTGDLLEEFRKANSFDPLTHETDKPVEDEDRKLGIRAWRKIADKDRPEHDTGVFLPIFDPEFFDDVQRSKIPQTGDDEHPELYVDHANAVYKTAVCWQELDDTPALWGEPGNGKTELGRYLAWTMCLPFERLSITASTELDDLAGKMHYEEGKGTLFKYGRLPNAWSKPGVIVLDEPNVGPPDVWQFIRPLTDNSKQLVLDMNEGERIKRNDSCYFIMAMNPAWDPRNVGANPIGDADQRRLMHIWMPPPAKEIEEEIIRQRCALDGYKIPKVVLNAVMQTAAELRNLSNQGTIPISWGVAPNIKVARATKHFGLIAAYKIAVTDFLEPSQGDIVLEAVRSNAPASLTDRGRGGGKPSPWS
jgi:MoxR-like ATPase